MVNRIRLVVAGILSPLFGNCEAIEPIALFHPFNEVRAEIGRGGHGLQERYVSWNISSDSRLNGAAATIKREQQRTEKPSIVVIVADDLGYADIGAHGSKDISTPNIDALAQDGALFTNAYVSAPYCSPSRAALLTGRYQTRFGHEFNVRRASGFGLPLTETTLADRLKAAGYATALVGKWHLGEAEQFHPQRRGFNEFFGFFRGGSVYFNAELIRGTEVVKEPEYLTDALGREAVAFVDRNKDRPFFLYLAFNAPHTPMQGTADGMKRFARVEDERRRAYAAMVWSMDKAIGAVLAELRDDGLERDTLVFFLSDNGGPVMENTSVNGSSNEPLRGSKQTMLEGGVRVPFIMKWPARIPAGAIVDAPVIQLDVVPTALAVAGLDPGPEIDGTNLLPHLTSDAASDPHDALYWRLGKQMAVRKGDWKLVRYNAAADGAIYGVSPGRLYNLAEDVGETHDLAPERPEKVKELQAAWDEWNKGNVEPLWPDESRCTWGAPLRCLYLWIAAVLPDDWL